MVVTKRFMLSGSLNVYKVMTRLSIYDKEKKKRLRRALEIIGATIYSVYILNPNERRLKPLATVLKRLKYRDFSDRIFEIVKPVLENNVNLTCPVCGRKFNDYMTYAHHCIIEHSDEYLYRIIDILVDEGVIRNDDVKDLLHMITYLILLVGNERFYMLASRSKKVLKEGRWY